MTSALIAAILSAHPPYGCVIDCSTWNGKQATENRILVEMRDGEVLRDLYELPQGTDPSSPRTGFKLMFGHRGWEYEMLGEYRFILYGSKTAPLQRVVIRPVEPGGWTPTYYFVWTKPPYTAPPPRAVTRK
jgi:hypothetical protein